MWQKPIKKTIFTLALNNWQPKVTEITYPLMLAYAHKIGADFYIIKERKLPLEFHPTYEKFQIYELAQEMGNDWNIYIDADTLIHPDFFDVTDHLPKDTVCHNGNDLMGNRYREDRFHWRDGRHISSCNWFTIASDWCIEVWKPLDDLTHTEAVANITPTVNEKTTVITQEHLIDDYVMGRNIAKYGLKFTTVREIHKKLGMEGAGYLWHHYTIPPDEKVVRMKEELKKWGLE
jgi:hypothetical protein